MKKQYSYTAFSFGYTFNFKSGRKVSDDNRIKLDKDKFLDYFFAKKCSNFFFVLVYFKKNDL